MKAESFTLKLARANLVSINDITIFVKKTDFDNKLKKLNKNITSNKNEKVKAISTKGSTKAVINEFIILNREKYFSSRIFQIY